MNRNVAVIGGGASGLMAAISAASEGAHVVIFESADECGRTIRATGNGRCNMSNADIMSSDYNHPSFVQAAFNMMTPEDVLMAFADMGLLAYEEEEGRIYPYSGKAATVVDVLMATARECGVELRCGKRVKAVEPASRKAGWTVVCEDGDAESFDAVVVAVGGAPAKGIVPADIPFVRTHPVLAPLRTDTDPIAGLSGTRVRARLYLDTDPEALRDAWLDIQDEQSEPGYSGPEERGEILFRDYGVSGIAAFDMSRHVKPGDMVFIDFLPDMDPQDKVDFIYGQALDHPQRTAAEIVAGMLPADVARAVVRAAGINPDEPILAEQEAVVIAMVSESFGLVTRGVEGKQAQVTRGGYALDAFNPATMECFAYPGLHIAGEALDVDGRCGGYNLHWAWTSGILAGRAAAGAELC